MKNFTILITLIFSMISSSASYAAWEKMATDVKGNVYYVDVEKAKIHNGHVYFWMLMDFLKPINYSHSSKSYYEGDCKLFRYKLLSVSIHKDPMAGGSGKLGKPFKKDQGWKIPRPKSSFRLVFRTVCEMIKPPA